MTKCIPTEKLIAEIERRKYEVFPTNDGKVRVCTTPNQIQSGWLNALKWVRETIISLQQEQPIKVYRVENEKEQKGLWRKFDGTWEPLFDMLTDGQCRDMPMEDSPIYREGGKQWFASAPSKETLQKWFSKRDLEELIAKGFTISEFEVVGHKKVSDFEYIFTRDNIISRTYLKVSDIYPQEQLETDMKSPFTGGKVTILSREEEVTFRGEKVKIIRKYYRCVDTGREFTDSKLDDDMMWSAFRAYCEKKGMTSFTDIMLRQEQSDQSECVWIHKKYNRAYRIVSDNARLKNSNGEWIDCVIYAPLYENEFEMFAREKNSFYSEFEKVK